MAQKKSLEEILIPGSQLRIYKLDGWVPNKQGALRSGRAGVWDGGVGSWVGHEPSSLKEAWSDQKCWAESNMITDFL